MSEVSINLINAAPNLYSLGTQDNSTRQVSIVPNLIPNHCPKTFIYAAKGLGDPIFLASANIVSYFGSDTFDPNKSYYNHATAMLTTISASGNNSVVQRIIPDDAVTANMVVYLDVLTTTVNIYQRNLDGSIFYDTTGNPVSIGTTAGYKVKWIKEFYTLQSDVDTLIGLATQKTGTMTDPTTGASSVMYPIFDIVANSPGNFGNLSAIRLWAANYKDTIDPSVLSKGRTFPYFFSMYAAVDTNTSPKLNQSLLGSAYVAVGIRKTAPLGLTPLKSIMDSFSNTTNNSLPYVLNNLNKINTYQNSIDSLLQMFITAEIPQAQAGWDFTTSSTPADSMYLFNFVSGTNFSGIPYTTYQFVDDTDSFRFTKLTNVFASGGNDGTMSSAVFDTAVATLMADYLNPDSKVQDLAINPESIIYDSGFGLNTKLALTQFIGLRKNTNIALSTYTVNNGDIPNDVALDISIATLLKARLSLFPESDYFGTPVMRGYVIGQSMELLNSPYTKRVPLTFDIANKMASYMGAGNGVWNSSYNPEGQPGSIIKTGKNIQPAFLSGTARYSNWFLGLNWAQAYDLTSFYTPAYKTIYSNDTSVLNSFITTQAIASLNTITAQMWRGMEGISNLTAAQFKKKIVNYMNDAVKGLYDNRYVIIPVPELTALDEERGYSITLAIKIYANNMKTVLTTYTQAYRMSDLVLTNG